MCQEKCSLYRDEILRHFSDGAKMRPEARTHYAECVDCMAAVTAVLSRNVSSSTSMNGRGSDGEARPVPEAARRALAHGAQVLERVFGIGSNNHSSADE
jgi:hypothetical protein